MRDLHKKILNAAALALCLQKERRRGRNVVFTNGCFDLLHEGHVTYLQTARSLGDLLVVALDTDAAVRTQKGAGRPINALKSRQKVMAALESVDYVTFFGGSNPLPLIKKLKPNILVKGGDWSCEKILGAHEVLSWGGEVYSLRYVKVRSTTGIVKKIQAGKG